MIGKLKNGADTRTLTLCLKREKEYYLGSRNEGVKDMTEQERLEFYHHCITIGFIIPSIWDWTDSKLLKKIKQYMLIV